MTCCQTDQRAKAVMRASAMFASNGLRFTPLRQRVFEIIAEDDTHIGAYDILKCIREQGVDLSPITIYRTLDALVGAGVVRRLKSKSAYFAAQAVREPMPGSGSQQIYLACEKCGRVTEASSAAVFDVIGLVSDAAKFRLGVENVEVTGTCARCETAAAP